MKIKALTVTVILAVLFLITGILYLYAASGDLIVNGNLTVSGTVNGNTVSSTPTGTAIPVSGSNSRLEWGWKPAFRGCRAIYYSNSQQIPSGYLTAIEFNSENFDTDNIHDTVTNKSMLVVPAGVTKVRLTGGVEWGISGTGVRFAVIVKNGGFWNNAWAESHVPASTVSGASHSLDTGVIPVTAGNYFQLAVYQNSGSSLLVMHGSGSSQKTFLTMEIIE